MGMKQLIDMLTNFLSNKINLTILQCSLYLVLGYMLNLHYNWTQLSVVAIVIVLINFITHIKGISHGMFISEIMYEENHQLMKFLKKVERKHNKSNKDSN